MQVHLGQVISNNDPTKLGMVLVYSEDLKSNIQVHYTSPYHVINQGGFFAPPTVGSYILFAANLESNEFFYLSTVVSKMANTVSQSDPAFGANVQENFQEIKDVDKIYGKASLPQQLKFTDYKGNGLTISNKYLKEDKRADLRTQMQSARGKVVCLNDSPHANMINIETAHGDGMFIIQGKNNKAFGFRSIHIKTKNSLNLRSDSQGINMTVVEGSEFNIKNLSTTVNGAANLRLKRKLGNVNILSKFKDVNIWTEGPEGAIFIRTPTAKIQIEPNGRIYLSGGTVDINVQGQFNVNATGGINLASAGRISIKSSGTVSVAGSRVNLNDPGDVSTPLPVINPPLTSGYEVS